MFFISLVILPSFSGENESPNSDISNDPPNIIWSKTYGSGSALSVQQTSDEGYILSGIASGYAQLIKTDKNGSEEWITNFEGKYGDEAYDAIECNDGGYICTGGLSGKTFLIKTDDGGNISWHKTFRRADRKGSCWGTDVVEVSDGYVVLANLGYYGSTEIAAAWLIKTDKNGNELWNRTYGGGEGELVKSLIIADDNCFIFVGSTSSYDIGGIDVWLLKTDSEGNELWNKSYGGYSYDVGFEVKQTEDNGFVIVGRYTPSYEGFADVCLIKTDSSGNMEWIRYHGGTDQDSGYSVASTDDDGYMVVGMRHSGLSSFQGWMLKTDRNGNKLWDEVIGGHPSKIIKSNDGNYIVAGSKTGGAWLFKFEDFENNPPSKPTCVYDKNSYQLKITSSDLDGDRIRFGISWYNNGVVDEWTGYYDSGEEGTINCFGKDKPAYMIAEDEYGGQSEWVMAKAKPINPLIGLFNWLWYRFPILEELFRIWEDLIV